VDNNVAHRVFFSTPKDPDPDFKDLSDSLFGRRNPSAKIVYGGGLKREYLRSGKVRRVLLELDRNGRAQQVKDSEVDAEEKKLMSNDVCVSDDEHVIALARISGARLLCSDDNALENDFRNHQLVNSPRGNIYKRCPDHNHLIDNHCR